MAIAKEAWAERCLVEPDDTAVIQAWWIERTLSMYERSNDHDQAMALVAELRDYAIRLQKTLRESSVYGRDCAADLERQCDIAILNHAISERVKRKIVAAVRGLDIDTTIKGAKFKPKRQKGAVSEKTKYIRQLVQNNPGLSAKELQKRAGNYSPPVIFYRLTI